MAMFAWPRIEAILPESIRINPLAWMRIWNEICFAFLRLLIRGSDGR